MALTAREWSLFEALVQRPNQLLGHLGADVYAALAGEDSILANSGDDDLAIDCGEGIDSALIDASIEAVDIELPGWDAAHAAALTVLFGEALIVNDDIWRHRRDQLGEDLVERFTFAQAISPAELGDARAQREP